MTARATAADRSSGASRDGWDFYRDEHRRWRWKYIMHGRTVAHAYEAHARYADCVADAKQHGYRENGETAARHEGGQSGRARNPKQVRR